MFKILGIIVVGLLCITPRAVAHESFKVQRPNAQQGESLSTNLHDPAAIHNSDSNIDKLNFQVSGARTDSGMLGQFIFAGMRTPLAVNNFDRWRQNYCDPIICNMVLCNGSCVDFEEHCPTLTDSKRAIHIHEGDCIHSEEDALKADGKECCGDNI